MIQEHAHVPKTLRNVLTPSVFLSVQSCVCVGVLLCMCVMGMCRDGGVTVPVCLCVQPP